MKKLASLILFVAACGGGRDVPPGSPGDGGTRADAALADSGSTADSGPTDSGTQELCRIYCLLADSHCTGADQLYANDAACQAACAQFPASGADGDTSGDSIYCRLTFVDQPSANDPATNCPNAGPTGGTTCI